jgi:CHAD domain-containing protein
MYLVYKTRRMQSKEENFSISSFYRKRFDSFLINLSVAKQLKEEDIHKLRVDMKYIRGLMLLIEEFNLASNVGTKLLKQIRSIYNSAGKLRACQVTKSLLLKSNVEIPSEISTFLEDELSLMAEKFGNNLSQFDRPKFNQRVIQLYSELDKVNTSELKTQIDSIIHDELEIVNKLFNSSKGEEYHHEIRKLLKLIKSLQQLLLAFREDENSRQALDIVNSTETLLGNWHDYKVLDDFLNKLDKELPQTAIKRVLRNLKNQNNKLRLELKNESDKYLRNHF